MPRAVVVAEVRFLSKLPCRPPAGTTNFGTIVRETNHENMLGKSLCWNCQSTAGGQVFCPQCVKLQPVGPDSDYFQHLGFPRRLAIQPKELEDRFHELSRKYHPDFFQNQSDREKEVSLENSAYLNAAYRTLRDPIRRVEYLIRLEEGAAKNIPAKAPPDLLEEIIALQETLEDYRQRRSHDAAAASKLEVRLRRDQGRISERKNSVEEELFNLFGDWDRPGLDPVKRRELLARMKDLMSSRAYFVTVLEDLEESLPGKGGPVKIS